MGIRTLGRVLAALGFAALAAGCNSASGKCAGRAATLAGTYDLLEYGKGGTSYTAPAASGELRLHADSYGLSIVLPGPTAVTDTGTYEVCGATGFVQQSLAGRAEFSGVYILSADTLWLSGTATSVWHVRP